MQSYTTLEMVRWMELLQRHYSIAEISRELGVDKSTVVKWSQGSTPLNRGRLKIFDDLVKEAIRELLATNEDFEAIRARCIKNTYLELTREQRSFLNRGHPAVKFLEDELADGPREASIIKKKAEKLGIGITPLYRCANQLGVVRDASGFGQNKKSLWSLTRVTG